MVWAVNITGDGRLVVAAYGDGTIRWHRLEDGVELLAFMPHRNQHDWVAWTPEGIYDAIHPGPGASCSGTAIAAGRRPRRFPSRPFRSSTGPRCCP